MHPILFIDTTDNKEIKVGLDVNGKKYLHDQPVTRQKAQIVLPLIEKLLKEQNLTITDIKEISVNEGPGSFTGIRVGLTIANTLGFLLKIPINQKPIGELINANYTK